MKFRFWIKQSHIIKLIQLLKKIVLRFQLYPSFHLKLYLVITKWHSSTLITDYSSLRTALSKYHPNYIFFSSNASAATETETWGLKMLFSILDCHQFCMFSLTSAQSIANQMILISRNGNWNLTYNQRKHKHQIFAIQIPHIFSPTWSPHSFPPLLVVKGCTSCCG